MLCANTKLSAAGDCDSYHLRCVALYLFANEHSGVALPSASQKARDRLE